MKTKIKIPKDFYKGIKYKIKIVKHSKEPICFCIDCINRREKEKILLNFYEPKS